MNLHGMSASRMGKLIRSRELSPVELVQTQLARIDQLNPKLNAFVELRTELALAEARQAEMALQHDDAVGPLVCARQALEATVADPSACPHISAASAGLSRPPAEFPYQAIGLRARAPLRCSGWSGQWRERWQTWS